MNKKLHIIVSLGIPRLTSAKIFLIISDVGIVPVPEITAYALQFESWYPGSGMEDR